MSTAAAHARWTRTTLGEVLEFQRGFDITRSAQREGRVPVISSGGPSSWHNVAMSKGPGVVIGRKGSLGGVYYAEGPYWPHDTTLWVRDFKGSHPRFVYYFLKTLDTRSMDVGSANPALNRNHLHPLQVRWPTTTALQVGIAQVLGALDDKIAANTRTISAVEVLALAEFTVMPRSSVSPLSATARFINGRNFTKEASGSGRVVIRIAELNSGLGGSTVYSDAVADADNVAGPGTLLFAWSGSLTLHRWYRDEGLVNQHIFKVIPQPGVPIWLVHQLLQEALDGFRAIAAGKATTMGHIQRKHLDIEMSIPTEEVISRRHSLMQGLWDSALSTERESLKLAELRDTMLPALMSGQLTVREAERQVEAVV